MLTVCLFITLLGAVPAIEVNNNAPMFSTVKYMFQVSDPAAVGFIIGTVSATDGDMGDNGMVTYSLRNGTEKFAIDAHTGQITLVSSLTSGEVTFTVRATDNGDPALSSDAQVLVKSSETTQSGPVFQKARYIFSASEVTPVGTIIGVVKATDPDFDLSGMVRYSLLDNGSDLFSVDSRTGLVLTKAVLDHETRASVTLTVKAAVGGRSSTVKVDVNILDVNDEGPMFSPANYKFTVLEDTPVGSFIGQVNAIDKDSGSNGVVKYTLLDTGSSHQFSVESITGQISTMAALDREVQGSVTLTVSAADLGSNSRSATAVVNIDIVDVNDNAPMFTAVKYMFQVSDPAPVGFIIGTVSAIDGDMGDNGMVTYSLRNGTDQFDINAHTGQITLVSALTSADVTFIVRATDNGDPALSSDAQVQVKSSDAVLLG